MAKNTTRKGLALGAALALTTAGLVATPAQASDLSLVPSVGTGTSVLLSDTFTLHTAVTGNTNIANTAALKYEVVNSSGATLAYTAEFWDTVPATDVYADATPTATGTTTQIVSVASVTQTIGKVNKLTINPTTTATSTTFSVTVRSFSDLDSSGSVTSGDLVSPAVTVTFHKSSDLTVTTTLDTLVAGSAPKANLAISPAAFNLEMTALANFNVTFSVNGAAATNSTSDALNTAKTAIVGTSGANAAAGQVITAQAQVKSDDVSALADIGSSVTATVPAASLADSAEATIANSANVKTGTATPTGSDVNITKDIRSGTSSLSFDVQFLTGTAALKAASPVTITVTEVTTTIAADENITVNGTKLTGAVGATQAITVNTMTSATGLVTIAVTEANAKNGDNIVIDVVSATGTVKVDLKWVDAAIDNVFVTNNLLSDTERTIVKGGSTTVSYLLVDQFKQPWKRTDYNYRLTITPSGTATAPSPVVLSNGAGTLNWTDNSTAASGAYNLVAQVQDQTGTGAWADVAGKSATTVVNVVAAAPAPSAISVATALLDGGGAIAATGVPLAATDLSTLDNRVDSNTVAGLGVAANKGAKFVATVTGSNGGNVKGASVTVSAAGVYFATAATGSGVVTKDSITLNTATDGTVTVYAYSNVAGKKTITYTSGSVTKTQDVTWASAAAADGTAITLDVPASAKSGSTFKVTGKIVDKYGNPVEIATAGTAANPTLAVSYAGPGLVSGSLPTTTSAAGEFVFYVLLGSNDSGSATVTASYDADGTTATKSAIAASKTVAIGASAVAAGTSVKRTGNTVAVRVTGANARIVLNGARVASRSTAGVLTRTLTLRAGRNVIQLVVGGEVVRTVRYTR